MLLWAGAEDAAAEKYGHSGQAAVLLLLLHHRLHHVSGMDAGSPCPGHVHHWCQVGFQCGC